MKVLRAVVVMMAVSVLFCGAEAVARTASLTTLITITVKAQPASMIPAQDPNMDMLMDLAKTQPMRQAYVREEKEIITAEGEKVYTISERL